MKTPAFQRRVAEALGDQKWLDEVAHTGATKDLALQVIKATVGAEQVPLIELRVSGNSPEAALNKMQAAIGQLIRIHGELAKPALNRMRTDLAITREKLTSAERDLESLNKLVAAAGVKDDRFTQLALMSSLRIQKEAETFYQRQMIMALETALEVPATQAAKAIEEVFISDKPVSQRNPYCWRLAPSAACWQACFGCSLRMPGGGRGNRSELLRDSGPGGINTAQTPESPWCLQLHAKQIDKTNRSSATTSKLVAVSQTATCRATKRTANLSWPICLGQCVRRILPTRSLLPDACCPY